MTNQLREALHAAFKALPADWESYFNVIPKTGEIELRFNEDYSSWITHSAYVYTSVPNLILLVLAGFNQGTKTKD